MTQASIKLHNIKSKIPVVHKLVYELRYQLGWTYLDRCGRILTLIERDHPQWIVEAGQVNPQGASLVNLENGTGFRFNAAALELSWEQAREDDELTEDALERFFDQSESFTALVLDELGIQTEQLTRIGFRVWYLFSAETQQEAELWLRSLRCYQVPDGLEQAFEGKIDSVSVGIVLIGKDRCYRLGFAAGERQTQVDAGSRVFSFHQRSLPKKQRDFFARTQERQAFQKRVRQTARFVAIVDIDAYQENPLVLDVGDFLRSSWEAGYGNLRRAVQ